MSVRRRNIRERVERERRLKAGYDALTLSLQQIQDAITAARARGETTCTDQFLREAFGARMETEVRCTCRDFPGADEFCTAHKFNPTANRGESL